MNNGTNQSKVNSPLRVISDEDRAAMKTKFEAMKRESERRMAELPAIRAAGVDALKRLLPIAQGRSGQCRHVAGFLLSLYNGTRFKFDLTDFRCLDIEIFDDCLTVLKMDFKPLKEVHLYFENGSNIWEALAERWNIPDYRKTSSKD